MPRMPRRNLRAAARGGIVLLLMATLMTGFGEPDGLVLGSNVAGTPTVGILGSASANGTQVSGEVVQLNLNSSRPTITLSTTAGFVTIVLADPLLAAGLGVGVTATFVGEYVSADLFNGHQVISNSMAGPSDLTLGDPVSNPGLYGAPLDPSGDGGTFGVRGGGSTGSTGTTGTTGSSGSTGSIGTSSLTTGTTGGKKCSSSSSSGGCPKLSLKLPDEEVEVGETFKITIEASHDDGIETMWWWASKTDDGFLEETHILDCANATRCRKSFYVSSVDRGETYIHAQARNGFGVLSAERKEKITIEKGKSATATPTGTSSACSTNQSLSFTPDLGSAATGSSHKVNVTVNGSGNCSGKKVYLDVLSGPNNGAEPGPQTLDSKNQATLSYVGTQTGSDTIRVWLDHDADTDYDLGEPTMLGAVVWSKATATPTATRTATPTKMPTATPTRDAGSSKAKQSSEKESSSKGTPTPTKTKR